jgi:hypothetical protein
LGSCVCLFSHEILIGCPGASTCFRFDEKKALLIQTANQYPLWRIPRDMAPANRPELVNVIRATIHALEQDSEAISTDPNLAGLKTILVRRIAGLEREDEDAPAASYTGLL